MIIPLEIDLNNLRSSHELFDKFNQKLGFPNYFWNNWNAFYDVMRALDSDSRFISTISPLPEWIHLILLNFDLFEKHFNKQDLTTFKETLVDLCKNKRYRYDKLSFTFELQYSKDY